MIGVANADLKLFPGMTANVKILVKQRQNELKIPNAALRYHPPAEPAAASAGRGTGTDAAPQKAVWILDASHASQRVVVTTGETDGTFREITSVALKDGDLVIVAALTSETPASGGSPGSQGGGRGRGPGF